MVKAIKGVLVQCDPSIKAIIMKIDGEAQQFIVEDLDDETVIVKESKVADLKERLSDMLKDTQNIDKKDAFESDSD